jgi:hypothetical protein
VALLKKEMRFGGRSKVRSFELRSGVSRCGRSRSISISTSISISISILSCVQACPGVVGRVQLCSGARWDEKTLGPFLVCFFGNRASSFPHWFLLLWACLENEKTTSE